MNKSIKQVLILLEKQVIKEEDVNLQIGGGEMDVTIDVIGTKIVVGQGNQKITLYDGQQASSLIKQLQFAVQKSMK